MSERSINQILATMGTPSVLVPSDIQRDIDATAAALREARDLVDSVVEYFETTGCPKCCRTEVDQTCIYHVARRLHYQWKGDD